MRIRHAQNKKAGSAILTNQRVQPKRTKRTSKKETLGTKGKCFLCNKSGHWKRSCPLLKERHSSDDEASNMDPTYRRWQPSNQSIAMVLRRDAVHACVNEWILDSGSDVHVCIDRGQLLNVRTDDDVEYMTWTGDATRADLIGDVMLTVNDERARKRRTVHLKDVRYSSGGSMNILSLHQLECAGWKVRFAEEGPKKCWLLRGDAVIELIKHGRHYVLAASVDELNVMAITKREPIAVWHRRLGHAHFQTIKEGLAAGVLRGVELSDTASEEEHDCITCMLSKSKRMSYKTTHPRRSQVAYEKLITDVCYVGTSGVATVGGSKQFQIIMDEATRFVWSFLLKRKSEASANLTQHVGFLVAQGHKVKAVACDQGREIVNAQTKSFLCEKGVHLVTTNAYSPEENALVEKINGVLMAKVRAMIHTADLPAALWGEALNCAVDLYNVTPVW